MEGSIGGSYKPKDESKTKFLLKETQTDRTVGHNWRENGLCQVLRQMGKGIEELGIPGEGFQ